MDLPTKWRGAVESFLKKMGYRFVLRQLTHPAKTQAGGVLCLKSMWENKGVAPPYRQYPRAFRLVPVGRQGAPFYSGAMTYLVEFEHGVGRAELVLPEVYHVCSLRCDGVVVGERICEVDA